MFTNAENYVKGVAAFIPLLPIRGGVVKAVEVLPIVSQLDVRQQTLAPARHSHDHVDAISSAQQVILLKRLIRCEVITAVIQGRRFLGCATV